jgi:hypothetical protein
MRRHAELSVYGITIRRALPSLPHGHGDHVNGTAPFDAESPDTWIAIAAHHRPGVHHAGNAVQQTHPHLVGPVMMDFLSHRQKGAARQVLGAGAVRCRSNDNPASSKTVLLIHLDVAARGLDPVHLPAEQCPGRWWWAAGYLRRPPRTVLSEVLPRPWREYGAHTDKLRAGLQPSPHVARLTSAVVPPASGSHVNSLAGPVSRRSGAAATPRVSPPSPPAVRTR